MNDFNFFKVLSKDDKEAIHSAFLKFLFEENSDFLHDFLGLKPGDVSKPLFILEATPKKIGLKNSTKKRFRFDLVICSDESIIVIENKFKSLPNPKQLEKYNELFDGNKDKDIKKYILSFSNVQVRIEKQGWEIKTYRELIEKIRKLSFSKGLSKTKSEKKLLCEHYIDFLDGYLSKYTDMMENGLKGCEPEWPGGEKFWKKIYLSQVATILLDEKWVRDCRAGGGSTLEPLLDIYPNGQNWYSESKALKTYFQVQNSELKFYASYKHEDSERAKKEAKEIQNKLRFGYSSDQKDFRNISKKDRNNNKTTSSFYIFKTKKPNLYQTSPKNLAGKIGDFYKEINDKLKTRGSRI